MSRKVVVIIIRIWRREVQLEDLKRYDDPLSPPSRLSCHSPPFSMMSIVHEYVVVMTSPSLVLRSSKPTALLL